MDRHSCPFTRVFVGLLLCFMAACAIPPAATSFPTETNTPLPTEAPSSEATLYRGNPQRSGVLDFPPIRAQPTIQWQTKVSSTWLMPPILAENILYTGSGDGVLYAIDAQTGEELWSMGEFGQLENSGAVAGDILVVGGYNQQVRALDRHTGDGYGHLVPPASCKPLL